MASEQAALDLQETPRPADLRRPRSAQAIDGWTTVFVVLMGGCSVAYFYSTIVISIRAPLWMDEVMASWMAQLHPAKMIWAALLHGNMSSPPAYFYLLKLIAVLFGASKLALRFPSIVAVYVAAIAVFLLVRRRLALPYAVLAMALCLETGLFDFATEVREYALVTACFALAVLFWDVRSEERLSPWRTTGISLLLAACVSLHFYGVLLVPAFALMEVLWSVANHRIRRGLWVGIILAGASVLIWYPLMRRVMSITGGYASSAKYFALPSIPRLLTAYADLAFGGKGMSIFCCFLLLLAAAFFWSRFRGEGFVADRSGDGVNQASLNLEIIMLATVSVPFLVFLFAELVTKAFNERYAIVGTLGFAMLVTMLISRVCLGKAISGVLLFVSIFLLVAAPKRALPSDHYGMELLSSTGKAPIVVGEGLAFLELEAEAKPELRDRLVYLTLPAGEKSPDSTNEDLVKRWQRFRPDLKVEDPGYFLQANQHFFVLHTNQSTDAITPWLIRSGRLRAKWNLRDDRHDRDVWLLEAGPESVPGD